MKQLNEEQAAVLPREFNNIARCGVWYLTNRASSLFCDGRLFGEQVRVDVQPTKQGWTTSIVRRPRQWDDPLSTKPITTTMNDDPVESYRQAIDSVKKVFQSNEPQDL